MIQRYGFNGLCDGESGRFLEDMVKDDDGEYVLFYDHETEVERLTQERDAFMEMNERLTADLEALRCRVFVRR